MVAVTDSRFTVTMDRRAFMHQTAFLAVKFCMHMILH